MADRLVSISCPIFLLGVMLSGIASGAEIKIENRMGTPGTGCGTPVDNSIIRLQIQGDNKLLPLRDDSGDGNRPCYNNTANIVCPAPVPPSIVNGSDSMTFNTTATTYRAVIEMGSWVTSGTENGNVQRRYTHHNQSPQQCTGLQSYRYLDFTVTGQASGLLTLRVQPSGNQYQVVVQRGMATLSLAKTSTDFTRTSGPYTPVNEPPVLNAQRFSVPENSGAATVVGTLVATDPDEAQLIYGVTGGTGQGVFVVNSRTGQITVANSSRLDFETKPNFTLQVQVTDNGTPQRSASATITIDVTDVEEADLTLPMAPSNIRIN